MPNFWIDTHAHIYSKEFDQDAADMLSRCEENNVKKIFMPNIDHTSIDAMIEVELKNPNQCYSMMGLHPCSVKKDFEKELYIVEDWLNRRKFYNKIKTRRYIFICRQKPSAHFNS